jgi:Na+/phosphate symporter
VEVEESLEVFNLRKIKNADAATSVTFDHAGSFLKEVKDVLMLGFSGLFEQNRHTLKLALEGQRKIQRWSNIIAANIFKVFRLLQWQEVEHTQSYAQTISSLQEISESVRDVVMRAHKHVSNNHSGLLNVQIEELNRVQGLLVEILERTARALTEKQCPDCDVIAGKIRELRILSNELDQLQIKRIQDNVSKTRLSILFYSFLWDSLKIAEQTSYLLSVLQEWLTIDDQPSPEPSRQAAAS